MTTDLVISRAIAVTVCLLALVVVVAYVYDPTDNLKELALLLGGGLLGRLSASRNSDPVPVTTNPGDTVAVEDAGHGDPLTQVVLATFIVVLLIWFGVDHPQTTSPVTPHRFGGGAFRAVRGQVSPRCSRGR